MIVVTPDRRISLVFLLLLLAASLYLSFVIARPFIGPILTAAMLAIAIYPLFLQMASHMRSRTIAAVLATILVLLAILLPTVMIVNMLAHEIRELYGWLDRQQTIGGGWSEYFTALADKPLAWIAERTGISQEQLRSAALERLQSTSAVLLNWARSLVGNLTGTVVDTFIMLFTLFFLLRDGERIRLRLESILPIEPRRFNELLHTISESIIANIYGVLAVALTQGAVGAVGYWIAGLPSVVLWSFATVLFSMIPLVGAAAVWVVAVIYLAVSGAWGKAIFMAVWGAGLISMTDNIVRPLVLSGRVKLNTLLIFFSLLGGVQAFGIIGLFVGPIIVSTAIALLKIIEEERREWEQASIETKAGETLNW